MTIQTNSSRLNHVDVKCSVILLEISYELSPIHIAKLYSFDVKEGGTKLFSLYSVLESTKQVRPF